MRTMSLAMAAATPLALAAPVVSAAQQFSDEDVGRFADALTSSVAVANKWAPRISSASSDDEAQRMTDQSQSEMAAAIQRTGMSLEQYNDMFMTAQADPALADRVHAALRQRSGGQARP